MPTLANRALLDLNQQKLYIDGQQFPWHTAETGPPTVSPPTEDGLQAVTLTFLVDDIDIIQPGSERCPLCGGFHANLPTTEKDNDA